jgi:hypothetical protein
MMLMKSITRWADLKRSYAASQSSRMLMWICWTWPPDLAMSYPWCGANNPATMIHYFSYKKAHLKNILFSGLNYCCC